jgi:transcriptional regulator EpsA
MDDLIHLTSKEQMYLWRALESSLAVRQRGQFFLWTQGQVQALIPHDVMVCARLDPEHQVTHIDCMQGVPLDKAVLSELNHPETGLITRVAHYCREAALPLVGVSCDEADAAHPLYAFVGELERLGLGHALFHDSGLMTGGSTFFGLLRLRDKPTDRHALLLQVLLPTLHMAFSRVEFHGAEDLVDVVPGDDDSELTDRQLEILHWVKLGKTNFEIAQILGISALTVKNHMQKLFKKLNVHNRAQAVAKVMSMRIGARPTPE